jgi:4Fe-4S ferredoxin
MDTPLNPPPRRLDSAKVRRAAADPARPGAKCKAEPGTIEPVVDRARCEGKADCIAVCPYDVFEVGRIEDADYRALPWLARLKLRIHGMKTAYTPHANRCMACGLCVVACPEGAIKLVERISPPPGEPMRLFF